MVCIPRIFREAIALGLHDDNLHLGFVTLYATAKVRLYLRSMYSFLKEHVLTCQVCQEAKWPIHSQKTPLQATTMARPYSRWIMDCHGPFPDSLDSDSDPTKSKRYVLAFIDQCILSPELCAVQTLPPQQ
jgi:hypothetical protein